MRKEKKLKLRAVATEDVEIISALLQDGLVAASDLHYQKDISSCPYFVPSNTCKEIECNHKNTEAHAW